MVESLRRLEADTYRRALPLAVLAAVVIAVPADLIDTPIFGRPIEPRALDYVILAVTAGLIGLIFAIRAPGEAGDVQERRTLWGGAVSFLAVGCPVCNQAVVALVGASSFITYMVTKTEAPVGTTVPVMASTTFDAEFASFGQELMLPASFEAERSGLAAELDIALDGLSPEVRAEVEENLAVIQNAVDEISAALESEPNNALLQEMLADAYRKELAVMRHVGGLARNATARNDI